MKKVLLYLLVGGIAAVLFVSCGMAPLDVIGEWTITGGTYEESYPNGDSIDGDYASGSLSIKEEAFTMSTTIEGEYDNYSDTVDPTDDITIEVTGNGYVSVNGKDKVISFFFSSYEQEESYDTWDAWDDDDEIEEESRSYFYSIQGSTMTLTRNWVEGDIDWNDDHEKSETIILERK